MFDQSSFPSGNCAIAEPIIEESSILLENFSSSKPKMVHGEGTTSSSSVTSGAVGTVSTNRTGISLPPRVRSLSQGRGLSGSTISSSKIPSDLRGSDESVNLRLG